MRSSGGQYSAVPTNELRFLEGSGEDSGDDVLLLLGFEEDEVVEACAADGGSKLEDESCFGCSRIFAEPKSAIWLNLV